MERVLFSPGEIPVLADVDLCVAGGSCTGVFAAVTAARRGARVALVEAQNRFGGTAVASLVCYWHSLFTLDGSRRIVSGLTQEVIDRLARRDAVELATDNNPSWYARLNTEELAIELDELIREAGILPFLHTRRWMFCATIGARFPESSRRARVDSGRSGRSSSSTRPETATSARRRG